MVITDPAAPGGTVSAIERALRGASPGRVMVQLRDKEGCDRDRVALGRALRGLTRAAGALLVINGRPDLARIVGADGVHLPERGLSPTDARRVLKEASLVGVSCHDRESIARARMEGADYLTVSPFAASPGKGPPLGAQRFAALVAASDRPVFALGGMGADEVGAALAAGAHGIAVIRAVSHAPSPADAVRALLGFLDTARPDGG